VEKVKKVAADCGADAFVKPFELDDLYQIVGKVI
jgi:hypothetical protein